MAGYSPAPAEPALARIPHPPPAGVPVSPARRRRRRPPDEGAGEGRGRPPGRPHAGPGPTAAVRDYSKYDQRISCPFPIGQKRTPFTRRL